MKKILTLLLLFIVTINYAQVPLTVSYNGTDVTNQNIHLRSDETMYLPISNNGSVSMNVTVEITSINVPHKAPVLQVCWEACYTPSAPQSVGTRAIAAGDNSGNNFDVFYSPDGNTNPANITFHIYEAGNSADYISLTLDTEIVGINDINQNNIVSIFPNPASNFFKINIPESSFNSELIISNIIGKTVLKRELKVSETKIDTRNYASGIYFVSVISEGKIIDTKKLIIK